MHIAHHSTFSRLFFRRRSLTDCLVFHNMVYFVDKYYVRSTFDSVEVLYRVIAMNEKVTLNCYNKITYNRYYYRFIISGPENKCGAVLSSGPWF